MHSRISGGYTFRTQPPKCYGLLQEELRLKPASVNRTLISLKRYFAWACREAMIQHSPTAVVKLVGYGSPTPRHLTDAEEDALIAAVSTAGTLRDKTMVVLLLHTGLRAHELCRVQSTQIVLGTRSETLQVIGKRNKYREVPLNSTARAALQTYLPTLPAGAPYLFTAKRTNVPLSERSLGLVIHKYAAHARLTAVSPHDRRHRFGYRMAERVPLHRLAQIMGHDSIDTTLHSWHTTRSATRSRENCLDLKQPYPGQICFGGAHAPRGQRRLPF